MPRNAQSFIVDKMPHPVPAGAIEIRRGWEEATGDLIMSIKHACPCGCGGNGWMPFEAYGFKEFWSPQPKAGDDLTKMTLTPSIGFRRQPDGSFHWHGYLRNGIFEEI